MCITTYFDAKVIISLNKIIICVIFLGYINDRCRERDSNPHSHYWPRDFKSLVSTNSTIAASASSEIEM